jgi:hypothetical protein
MPDDGSGISVTICHDGQFCVAYCERWGPRGRSAARIVLGAEPALPEVAGFVNSRTFLEIPYLPLGEDVAPRALAGNPKRRQREAARAAKEPAASTRSQAALQAALDERKQERRAAGRRRRAEETDERYLQRVEKRRAKRRGH